MNINELLICPNCKGKLKTENKFYICENCNSSYEIISNIPVLISHNTTVNDIKQKNLAEYFDSKYQVNEDPWDYESSAAEIMKYEFVTHLIKKLNPNINNVLDVACSFGYLSHKLSNVSKSVIGIDVSLNALMKANDKYKKENIFFVSAGAENIPLKDKTMDAVILCDGLNGMDLTGVHRDNAVKESLRVLNENGFTIFTDYLKPKQFEDYINYLKKSDYKIKEIYYLNDRLWYKLKYGLNAFKNNSLFKKFLSSITVGKILAKASSLFGKRGSSHICIVASRN